MILPIILRARARIGAASLGWLVLAILALGIWLSVREVVRRPGAALLPKIPTLGGHQPALVKHLRRVDRAARSNPNDAPSVGTLGMAYHTGGFYEHAKRCYRRAQELDRSDSKWTYYHSLLEEELGNTRAVVQILEPLLDRRSDLAIGWYRLGEARFKLQQYDRAEQAYQLAARQDQMETEAHTTTKAADASGYSYSVHDYAWLGIARVVMTQGRATDAHDILTDLVERSPGFGPAHTMLGRVYQHLDREADGRSHHELADTLPQYFPPNDPLLDVLIHQSHNSNVLRKYAQIAQASRDKPRAQSLARLAMQLNPTDPDEMEKLGRLLFDLDLKQDALRYLRQHLETKGLAAHVKTMQKFGLCLVGTDQRNEAEIFFRQSIATHPDVKEFHCELGLLLASRQRHVEAVSLLKRALKIDPDYAEAHNGLGNSLGAQGRIDQAIDHYRQALVSKPDHAPAHYNLGHALRVTGHTKQSLTHFRKLASLEPQNPEPLNIMAWLLATDPDVDVRDGPESVELATRAAELTQYKNAPILDSLAAAYAATGEFDHAVTTAQKAIALAASVQASELAGKIVGRLERYKRAMPYRRPAQKQRTPVSGRG